MRPEQGRRRGGVSRGAYCICCSRVPVFDVAVAPLVETFANCNVRVSVGVEPLTPWRSELRITCCIEILNTN